MQRSFISIALVLAISSLACRLEGASAKEYDYSKPEHILELTKERLANDSQTIRAETARLIDEINWDWSWFWTDANRKFYIATLKHYAVGALIRRNEIFDNLRSYALEEGKGLRLLAHICRLHGKIYAETAPNLEALLEVEDRRRLGDDYVMKIHVKIEQVFDDRYKECIEEHQSKCKELNCDSSLSEEWIF